MSFILATIMAASGTIATTYGYGEQYCGPDSDPETCEVGATTASGLPFDPDLPTAAIALKEATVMRPTIVLLRVEGGVCTPITFIDKKNSRYYRKDKAIDLTPGALRALGVNPKSYWSGRVYVCEKAKVLQLDAVK